MPEREPRTGQQTTAACEGHGRVRVQAEVRQLRARAAEGHPAAVDEYGHRPVTRKRGEHLVSRPPLVGAVVEEELVLRLERADHAHALVKRHARERSGAERAHFARAAREALPRRLAVGAALPLPKSEAD